MYGSHSFPGSSSPCPWEFTGHLQSALAITCVTFPSKHYAEGCYGCGFYFSQWLWGQDIACGDEHVSPKEYLWHMK